MKSRFGSANSLAVLMMSVAMLAMGCGIDERNLSNGPVDSAAPEDASHADVAADAEPTCGDCPGPVAGEGTPYCDRGTCKIRCRADQTLCGTNVCADLQNDGANCKACGMKCDPGLVCREGSCSTSCAAGLTPCDGSCVDLQSNLDHCNDCTKKCDRPAANGTAKCELGVCSVQCDGTLLYCNKTCIDSKNDKTNCGVCGKTCADSCKQGICCLADETNCSGNCVNLQNDPANCGICGKACGAGQKCQAAGCVKDCGTLTLCPDGGCYNLAIDPAHCLNCNTNCGAVANGKAICTASGCDADCGSNKYCNKACCPPPPPNQVSTCVQGQCGNACAAGVTTLTCANAISGKPACGAWKFESNSAEGWAVEMSVLHNAATRAAYPSASPGAGGGTYSLAVDVATDLNKYEIKLIGKVCPGGNKLDLNNLTFRVDVWFKGTPDSALVGPGYVYTYNGSTFIGSSGDQNLLPRQWQTWSVPGSFNALTDVAINVGFSSSTRWTGTVYFDNLRFE